MNGKPRVTCACLQCGAQFRTKPGDIKKGGGKFCSRACNLVFRRNAALLREPRRSGARVERSCSHCGKRYQALAIYLRKGRGTFCSRTCRAEGSKHRRDLEWLLDRSTPEPNSGCWLWERLLSHDGYGVVHGTRAHRVAWSIANGPIPTGLVVRHRCDVPACVNPDHLEIGTQLENIADCVSRERTSRGEGRPNARLTDQKVAWLRAEAAKGRPLKELALELGVTRETVGHAAKMRTWRHVHA